MNSFLKSFTLYKLPKYSIYEGKIVVEATDEFEIELGKLVVTHAHYSRLAFKTSDGEYHKVIGRVYKTLPKNVPTVPVLNFNGKDIFIKVIKTKEDEENTERKVVPHPEITKLFCKELGTYLTRQATCKKTDKKSTTGNHAKTAKPDNSPVQRNFAR